MTKPTKKILILDIECTDLIADFGTILCIGWKWLGEDEPVHIEALHDFKGWKKDVTDDKRLVETFYPRMVEADMMVTYFGTGFDKKMLQSKFLEHRLDVPPNTPHVDLFYTVKGNMLLSRKRLQNVAEFLGCPVEKTPIKAKIWKRAQVGYPDATAYVEDHCDKDVLITEWVYLRLRSYVRTHPRVAGLEECRYCGSSNLRSPRGPFPVVIGRRQTNVQCVDCRGWDKRRIV